MPYFIAMNQCGEDRPVIMTNADVKLEDDSAGEPEDWTAMFRTRESAAIAAEDHMGCRGNGYKILKW